MVRYPALKSQFLGSYQELLVHGILWTEINLPSKLVRSTPPLRHESLWPLPTCGEDTVGSKRLTNFTVSSWAIDKTKQKTCHLKCLQNRTIDKQNIMKYVIYIYIMELHSLSCFDPQLRPMWIRTIRLATREESMTIAQGFPTQKQIAMVDRRLKKNTRCLHVASTESTVFRVQPFGPAWFKGGIDVFTVTSHDHINTSNLRCHQTQPGNPPTQRSIFQETRV